ncbi:MAG: cell division protease FtsH [Solirubrobacteraceae bacterium]|jgi:cell division protease FtsH|nr:cell division protease FtsH [Solirubrobacteraceae bacterium]
MSGQATTAAQQTAEAHAAAHAAAGTHAASHAASTHAALVNAHAHIAAAHPVPVKSTVPQASISQEIQNWALQWEPVIAILFFTALIFLMWRTLKVMPRIKPQRIKPASDQAVTFDDIAGVDEAKAELQEIVEFLREPKAFAKLGAKVPKGILLHGPPGTGKTLLAKAVAHESGAQFFAQSAASFVEMFAGLGAARIRRLFAIARKHEPAIIFIDELDAVGGRRGSDFSGEKDQTLNQLLVEMDGFDTSGRVVVIAASNLLEKLDSALLRPGRFDRQVFVVPPDVKGRMGVLEVHTRDKPLREVDLSLVAQQTSGLTGADLANICNEAAIFATRRGDKAITIADFDSAIERVIAGVQSKRVLNAHEKRVVAYHEAGHALCGELLPSVDRVHRISIVPRGRALGYTLNLPAEDRYLKTREELLDYMTVLLGGRVAEQIVFGAITTGASDDLKRVADISHSMVHDYAMGTAGVGRSPDGDVRLSETTLRIRDEERQDLIDEARRAAQKLIVAHRRQLEALAQELLQREVLERDAIERIMRGVPRMERAPGVGLRVVAAAEPHAPLPGPAPINMPGSPGENEPGRL